MIRPCIILIFSLYQLKVSYCFFLCSSKMIKNFADSFNTNWGNSRNLCDHQEFFSNILLVQESIWRFNLLHWIGNVKFCSPNFCKWWTVTTPWDFWTIRTFASEVIRQFLDKLIFNVGLLSSESAYLFNIGFNIQTQFLKRSSWLVHDSLACSDSGWVIIQSINKD